MAVSLGGEGHGGGRGLITGYHELSDTLFLALLDEVGPRGVWGTAATLLGGCSAATFLVGGLAYHVSALWLSAGFASLACMLAGTLATERRQRRQALMACGVRLGLSEGFAAQVALDLERPVRSDEGTGAAAGLGASWPEERLGHLRALQHQRERGRAPGLMGESSGRSDHQAGEGGGDGSCHEADQDGRA
ncbi:MAG: hypothetical protein ACO3JL_04550 [Myxococcota bacterium]